MNATSRDAIVEDFLAWSGGFPPESSRQILCYVEFARPCDSDEAEVSRLLKNWMAQSVHEPLVR